jgi:hypothetical protein
MAPYTNPQYATRTPQRPQATIKKTALAPPRPSDGGHGSPGKRSTSAIAPERPESGLLVLLRDDTMSV